VTRWSRRLLFGAIAVLVPVLAGCEAGYNAPTLEFHPANFAANTVKGGVSMSNVFVLGPPLRTELPAGAQAGVFLSISTENGDQLVSVSAPGTASSVTVAGAPVDLPAQTLVDLSGPEPEVVLTGLTKPLKGGEAIRMNFTFAHAGTISLQVPVEPHAYSYATFSPPAAPSPSATPTGTASPSATPTGTASPSPAASASASATP
jgi:copper(I)-binding protein